MPLYVVRDDIARMAVDAIVSAGSGDPAALPTGGVEASIHAGAGEGLLQALRARGGVREGGAILTPGFGLPCRYVIHTAGPVWHGGDSGEEERLRGCYSAVLRLAAAHELQTLALPLISAGAHGYPREEALRVARETIAEFLSGQDMTVYLVVFDRASYLLSTGLFRDVQAYVDQHYVDRHPYARRATKDNMPLPPSAVRPAAPAKDKRMAAPADECFSVLSECTPLPCASAPEGNGGLPEELVQRLRRLDEGFSRSLLRLIDERGMTDPECYRRANLDRKLFSKIRSNPAYTPKKPTAVALCIALELDLHQTKELLSRAGYGMSHASMFDVIVEYFIVHGMYDVHAINQALWHFDQPLLGSLDREA
ncbi:MAG: macro domain-containing protein [Clostridia bacterium]|nr:macro domain-containing protein [Clostridia bacterium]